MHAGQQTTHRFTSLPHSRPGYFQLLADTANRALLKFPMLRHACNLAASWIEPDGVCAALKVEYASVAAQVTLQVPSASSTDELERLAHCSRRKILFCQLTLALQNELQRIQQIRFGLCKGFSL